MKINLNELQVVHQPELGRFEIRVEDYIAELIYSLHGNTITFTHTGVPPALEGQGVGKKLVITGLEYALANGFKIKSRCWFVTEHIKRHPEYQNS